MTRAQARRRVLLGLCALALPARSFGASAPPRPRLGFLGLAGSASPASRARMLAFEDTLRDEGYAPGAGVDIEYRWAEGKYDRLGPLAGELVALKPDLLVTYGTAGARAAMQATSTIPIVVAAAGDAIATDLNLRGGRLGRNVTGSIVLSAELYARRIGLLHEAFPRLQRIAVLAYRGNPANAAAFLAMQRAAESSHVALRSYAVGSPEELRPAFAAMAADRAEALATSEDPVLTASADAIADLALAHRLPSIGPVEFAEAGGLIGYGANSLDLYRRAARVAARILKGARPAYLPLETVKNFELIVNRKSEAALGLALPPSLLERADDSID